MERNNRFAVYVHLILPLQMYMFVALLQMYLLS